MKFFQFKNNKISMNELPNVEKPKLKPYVFRTDKTTLQELNKILHKRGIYIPSSTWFGSWTTNKDESITMSVDGRIVISKNICNNKTNQNITFEKIKLHLKVAQAAKAQAVLVKKKLII